MNDNQLLTTIPVKDAKIDYLEVYSNKEIKKYLSNDIDLSKIDYVYNGIDIITKDIKLNDKLGTISIKYNDELLDTYDVYLDKEIEYNKHYLKYIIYGIIIIFIIYILYNKKKEKI